MCLSFSLYFNGHFSRWTWVSRYQNVRILDFIGVEDGGSDGDNWSYKTCNTPVRSSPPTKQPPTFYGRMPFLSHNQQCRTESTSLCRSFCVNMLFSVKCCFQGVLSRYPQNLSPSIWQHQLSDNKRIRGTIIRTAACCIVYDSYTRAHVN